MKPALRLLFFLIFLSSIALGQEPPTPFSTQDSSQVTLASVASKLAEHAERVGCHSDTCSILVTDFVTNLGSTSRLGMNVSDDLAPLLGANLKKGKVLDRAVFHEFLAKERIPSRILAEAKVACWTGRQLGATVVLLGDIDVSHGTPQVMFTLLDTASANEPELFDTEFPLAPFSDADVVELEPFGPLAKPVITREGEVLYAFGSRGIKGPTCGRNPNPSYTEEARQARLNGSIVLDAVVKTDGKLDEGRILRGLPFGLNQQALAIIRDWRCAPGRKDGQPVPVLVAFEIGFRIK